MITFFSEEAAKQYFEQLECECVRSGNIVYITGT